MLLEIKNLKKSYTVESGTLDVLRGVSFCMERGVLRVLLGRSGSGKSTFLRLCAGHATKDSGELLFDGKPISGASSERFMVFQDFDQLFPWRHVSDNIHFALRSVYPKMSKSEVRETADFWLRETGLYDFQNLWPSELSGGMHQRAALARALALRPKLLLLDEPFSALDAHLRGAMQELLLQLCVKHGISALFVTHDINEALFLDPTPAVLTANGDNIVETSTKKDPRDAILRLLEE